jgi:hypothetical protein
MAIAAVPAAEKAPSNFDYLILASLVDSQQPFVLARYRPRSQIKKGE